MRGNDGKPGTGEPIYALGINYYDHDSAVALARDGRIIFAIAEERISRQKKDNSFPHRSLEAALQFAGIEYRDIAQVCFGWQRPGAAFAHDLKCFLTGSVPLSASYLINGARRCVREMWQKGGARLLEQRFGAPARPVQYVDHHYAHALSAFLLSGFRESAVMIVDGRGAWEATTTWQAGGGDCALLDAHPHPDSLGYFYAGFTQFLGFRPYSDEWKVMGLAPYGHPGVDLSRFISFNGSGYRVASRKLLGRRFGDVSAISAQFGAPRAPESELTDREKDIAWAVQDRCEEAMLLVAKDVVTRTGQRRLCLAGGVAMNSKANGKILASGIVDEIFIQPAATDDGTALGAALAAHRMAGGAPAGYRLDDVYLGPEYGEKEIEAFLRTCKIPFTRPGDIAAEGAALLAAGKIIGWFQGRMEFGPRALGSRSIVADPRDPAMKDRVNEVVKFREGWRPFAPSCLAERAEEYFVGCTDSPFMILTFPVREEKKSVIPAVTHADGSARVQTVRKDVNPLYHALISQFDRLTGVPVVMNTSYNLREEPIVCAPKDAVRTFYSSGLDALCLGPFLIKK
ncbi:MAG: carbamoyltransferase [Acidobacteria bacterium]|nr:carbamoyltransferase [Acidobacteriota bacterium]